VARTPTKSDWQAAYLAAVLEGDDASLTARIQIAEDAISRRLQLDGKLDLEEGQALFDAICGLRALRRHRLERNATNGGMS